MQTLTIEIANDKTLKLIEDLESLKLIKVLRSKPMETRKATADTISTAIRSTVRTRKERQELLTEMNLLASTIKTSSFGDAATYQRKVRKDRHLPNRD